MLSDTISVLDGNTFVVSDRRGDLDASPTNAHGLFHEDTRYLSRFRLTVDGDAPTVLSTDDVAYHTAQFFLVLPTGAVGTDPAVSIIRKRSISHGFVERLSILSHRSEPLTLTVNIDVDADFADLFEVKDRLTKIGDLYRRCHRDRLVLGYRRDTYVRETAITASDPGAIITEDGVRFEIDLEPHASWQADITVAVSRDIRGRVTPDLTPDPSADRRRDDLADWLRNAPRVTSDWLTVEETYRRSVIDLAALRLPAYAPTGAIVPAAGLPWFMCLFGRDSLITSYQVIPFVPHFAQSTLRLLAMLQAKTTDDFRDAEPGKIMHELRSGELTAFEQRPHSPYYGTADATPLFLVLLDEYERWTGDEALVHELEHEARAALSWIDDHGDLDGDGYVEYVTRNPETGLANQCWKDSHNSILFADGTDSALPRATCEIQGYVYDAKTRSARLARQFWGDEELAARLESEAAALKLRFNRDFWMPERDCFALALDGDGRRVDSITSNIGHLLWSGIVDDDKAGHCASHLLGPGLFSGWGVRTMATTEGGYNPVGYHIGTVWPHDNSLVAHGLARYGFRREAATLARSIFEAAASFHHRLPEAFAGYERQLTDFPVEYPTACSPQAWAAGSALLLLRTVLGLEPGFRLGVDPELPDGIDHIDISGVHGRWGRANASSRDATDTSLTPDEPGSLAHLLRRMPDDLEPANLATVKGTLQIEADDDTAWHLSTVDGRLVVSEGRHDADCLIRARARDLLDIYHGVKTPNIAAMQGVLTLEGDVAVALAYGTLVATAGANARRRTGSGTRH